MLRIALALGVLFKVLLSLGWSAASPTEPIVADRTLHMVTAGLKLLNLGSTLLVRTSLHALFDE